MVGTALPPFRPITVKLEAIAQPAGSELVLAGGHSGIQRQGTSGLPAGRMLLQLHSFAASVGGKARSTKKNIYEQQPKNG